MVKRRGKPSMTKGAIRARNARIAKMQAALKAEAVVAKEVVTTEKAAAVVVEKEVAREKAKGRQPKTNADVIHVEKTPPPAADEDLDTTHRGSCWVTREQTIGNIKVLNKFLKDNGCPIGDPNYEVTRIQHPGSMEYEFQWFRIRGEGREGVTDNLSLADGDDSFKLTNPGNF